MNRLDSSVPPIRLERAERRAITVVLGCILGLIALSLVWMTARQAAAQPSVIRAQRIDIVDSQGRVRISLQVSPETNSSIVSLKDREERERMLLAVLPSGMTELVLRDPQMRARLTLNMLEAGASEIQIRDTESRILYRAP